MKIELNATCMRSEFNLGYDNVTHLWTELKEAMKAGKAEIIAWDYTGGRLDNKAVNGVLEENDLGEIRCLYDYVSIYYKGDEYIVSGYDAEDLFADCEEW